MTYWVRVEPEETNIINPTITRATPIPPRVKINMVIPELPDPPLPLLLSELPAVAVDVGAGAAVAVSVGAGVGVAVGAGVGVGVACD